MLKKTGKKFLITIDDLVTIDNKSLPELREETFKVKSNNYDTEEEFKLYYRVKRAEDGKVSNYYVAHGRLVKPFTSEVKIDKLPDNSSSTMLLTSSYFDKHIKDDRKSFSIDVINESEEAPVTLLNINRNLKQKVDNILLKELPEIKETNNQNIEDAIREEPHLSKYIQESARNSSIANKQDLLKSAKKQYEKDRERIRSDFKKILENKKLKADEYQQIINEFNEFQVYELGRYIAYRQQIIEHLKQLNERNENSEELLHTLFMQMKTCEDNSQYHYKQNMWLIDDKFMSYLYIASDKTFNQINKAINGERIPKSQNGSDRPDLFVYFSDDENEKNVDCLVVELKAIGASDEEKNKSITELSNNVTTIRENMPNNISMFTVVVDKYNFGQDNWNFQYKSFQKKIKKIFKGYDYIANVALDEFPRISFQQDGTLMTPHIHGIFFRTLTRWEKSKLAKSIKKYFPESRIRPFVVRPQYDLESAIQYSFKALFGGKRMFTRRNLTAGLKNTSMTYKAIYANFTHLKRFKIYDLAFAGGKGKEILRNIINDIENGS